MVYTTGPGNPTTIQSSIVQIGRSYEITIDVVNYVTGTVLVRLGTTETGFVPVAAGSNTYILNNVDGEGLTILGSGVSSNYWIDEVSVREVTQAPSPLTQAGPTSPLTALSTR